MRKCKNVGDAVEYFRTIRAEKIAAGEPKETAGVGAQCILTGGPKPKKHPNWSKHARTSFKADGIVISSSGPLGNRLITVRQFCNGHDHDPQDPKLLNHAQAVQWLEEVFSAESNKKK